jgi:hypothetical protein
MYVTNSKFGALSIRAADRRGGSHPGSLTR